MKTHFLLLVAALLTAFTLRPNTARAQVKIGNNYTTIGTTSNLEVEATNGNKTIVNKATGQVTIQDGTQGSGKVLTSDANGASRWESGTSAFKASLTSAQPFPGSGNTFYNINLGATALDQDGGVNLTTDRFTITTPGTYLFIGSMSFNMGSSNSAASVAIFKNGVFVENSGALFAANTANAVNINILDVAAVGDYYELRGNINVGSMNVISAILSGTRVK